MAPITLGRFVRPVRDVAVVLAIVVLSVGATGPGSAIGATTISSPAVPPSSALAAAAVPGPAPGVIARSTVESSLAAQVTSPIWVGGIIDALPMRAPTPRAVAEPTDKPATVARPAIKPVKPGRTSAPTRELRGRNHVWSPSLGLDRAVSWFSCSRSRPPDYVVYRWGCAGQNNIYLFAHAGGPFRRLHDLYVRGHLHKGMAVSYADASGRVHRYTVAWWRVVLPTNGEFAYAAQSRPSMTLQTCVGSNDRYRLIVRLYQDD
jgi:hypothetical protein